MLFDIHKKKKKKQTQEKIIIDNVSMGWLAV